MRFSSIRPKLLSWLVAVVTLGLIAAYLWHRRGVLVDLVEVPWQQVVGVGLLIALVHWLNALEFWLIYRKLGTTIGILENWLLFTAGQLLNHLPGQVGTVYRFGYLRKIHDLAYGRSVSGYAANLVVTILVTAALGLFGALGIGTSSTGKTIMLSVFVILMVAAVLLLVLPLPSSGRTGRIAGLWRTFHGGWSDLTAHPRTAVEVALLEAVKYGVNAFRFQLVFGWIGFNAPWLFFLVVAAVNGVVTFVAFTPAGLGIRELAIAATTAVLGARVDQSLLGATIERGVLLGVALILGTVGLLYTSRKMVDRVVEP